MTILVVGTGQEIGKLKIQLQDVIAGKSIAEDINNALQVAFTHVHVFKNFKCVISVKRFA